LRKEKAATERKKREAQDAERRALLDEAVTSRNAVLKDDLARRRKDDAAAAVMVDGVKQKAMREMAELIDRTPEIDGEAGARTKALAEGTVARAKVEAWRVKEMPTRSDVTAPRVPSDFTKQYALLRKDSAGLYAYLRLVTPESCVAIFRPEVATEVLLSAAKAIAAHVDASTAAEWHTWLGALSKVGRFEMTVLMLDKAARATVAAMFDALAKALAEADVAAGKAADAAALPVADRLRKLRASYLGKE